jgi:branched-chain amino acid transport system permease protein
MAVTTLLALTLVGLVSGCIYALTATSLVVTYTTSGVFNFAQGAMGMVAAFSFWQLWQGWHLPLALALLVVLGVLAPLFGLGVERFLFRKAAGAPADQTLAVTLAMLLVLLGVANAIWPPSQPRVLPKWAGSGSVTVGILNISATQLLIIATAIAIAVLLRLVFYKTRLGMAMRAVVDDPDLLAMNGLEPARVKQIAWVLSSFLAALSGVLFAPLVQLNILNLTLLVVNGYAAAMVGRLQSLPRTVLGALGLGLGYSYVIGYGQNFGLLGHPAVQATLTQGLPMLMLFAVLVLQSLIRPDRLRAGAIALRREPRVPSGPRSLVGAGTLLALAVVLAQVLSSSALDTAARAFVLSTVALSMVLLTGYGGQVSLCTLTFVGLGAYAMGKVGTHHSLLGVLAAVGLSAATGALVALPTLRQRGLYLALATFAFGEIMDIAFFGEQLGPTGSLHVRRISFPGLSLAGSSSYFLFCASVFAAGAVALLAVRRSRFGRRLAALDDSPEACATIGMRINRVKLAVFAVSASMAGLAGSLFAGLGAGIVSNFDFMTLSSAVLFLLLRVGGVKTITGALFAGIVTAELPVLQQRIPSLAGLAFLVTGIAALSIGRFPRGLGGLVSDLSARRDRASAPAIQLDDTRELIGAH